MLEMKLLARPKETNSEINQKAKLNEKETRDKVRLAKPRDTNSQMERKNKTREKGLENDHFLQGQEKTNSQMDTLHERAEKQSRRQGNWKSQHKPRAKKTRMPRADNNSQNQMAAAVQRSGCMAAGRVPRKERQQAPRPEKWNFSARSQIHQTKSTIYNVYLQQEQEAKTQRPQIRINSNRNKA